MTRYEQQVERQGGRPVAGVPAREGDERERSRLAAGAIAGAVAGVAMAVWVMALYDALGLGFLAPLRETAALIEGPEALIGGFWMPVLGGAIHLIGAAAIGVVFGALLPGDWALGLAAGAGVSLGGAGFLVSMYLLQPWLDPTLRIRFDLLTGPWLSGYLVYGGALGALTWLLRKRAYGPEPDVAIRP